MEKINKEDYIVCPKCGYNMKPFYIKCYGTCLRCKETLDQKSYFKYELNKKLRLWRGRFK